MEYERIHKLQTGLISPSKLRMKLIGAHNQKKKEGSASNSSRTSPSKLGDNDFVKNSLLAADPGDFGDEVSSSEVSSVEQSGPVAVNRSQVNQSPSINQFSSESVNSSSVHPIRPLEDENLDYDSNASSSSFEFHKGERSMHHPLARSLSRPMSSKWNDAEKWIMSKQHKELSYYPKKAQLQSQPNRLTAMANMVRVAPESLGQDQKSSVKRVDFCLPNMEKPSFGLANGLNLGNGLSQLSKDLKEVGNLDLSCATSSNEDATGIPAIRSVSMRDMGTEMTPIPSQEPSRTATPVGATTPLRSPTSSLPSTPRRGGPTTTPNGEPTDQNVNGNNKKQLSEQELKDKTRREIIALGVQLGKMNIAEWARKDEEKGMGECIDDEKLETIEFEKRAAVWEEAEKTKHTARFKREEIKIQAWESQQKVKLEAEMRRMEAEVEQMRAHAQAKMVKKIAMARQKSEEKRAAAEARKSRQADKTAAQVEYIRQTGHVPSPSFTCCGLLS